jgi:hypothetical protein
MTETNWLDTNRMNWDERVKIHQERETLFAAGEIIKRLAES